MTIAESADFVVIGAGIAGLTIARELSEVANVIVVEREERAGYHATGRSAAIFVDSYGDSVVQYLSALSRPLLESPPFPVDVPLLGQARGILYVARRDTDRLPKHDIRCGLPILSARDARERVPILRETAVAHAYWEDGAADIDVHGMMTALQRRIRARGGKIISFTEVTDVRHASGRWTVHAGSLSVNAPVVINAGGAWSADIGVLFGAERLPLQPCRRTAATIATPTGTVASYWPMVVDLEESVYFKPDAGSLMLSLADESPVTPHDAFADDVDVAMAVDRFERLTDQTVRRVLSTWAGLRTFAPDRRPVIGFDSSVSGLFWLAGQGGFGIQTALGAAKIAKEMMLQAAAHPELDKLLGQLSPARFIKQQHAVHASSLIS